MAREYPLIRRVALDPAQVSADPRSRRRRTLHPDQRALPFDELAGAETIYAYSFILTNLDVSSPDKAAAADPGRAGRRGGKAMIATLRWRLIAVPGQLIRHARHLTLRLPPGHGLLPEVLARPRDLPAPA